MQSQYQRLNQQRSKNEDIELEIGNNEVRIDVTSLCNEHQDGYNYTESGGDSEEYVPSRSSSHNKSCAQHHSFHPEYEAAPTSEIDISDHRSRVSDHQSHTVLSDDQLQLRTDDHLHSMTGPGGVGHVLSPERNSQSSARNDHCITIVDNTISAVQDFIDDNSLRSVRKFNGQQSVTVAESPLAVVSDSRSVDGLSQSCITNDHCITIYNPLPTVSNIEMSTVANSETESDIQPDPVEIHSNNDLPNIPFVCINVCRVGMENTKIQARLSWLVSDFKTYAFPAETQAQKKIRIIFRGKLLSDEFTLQTCGIVDNSFVHVAITDPVERPPEIDNAGGASESPTDEAEDPPEFLAQQAQLLAAETTPRTAAAEFLLGFVMGLVFGWIIIFCYPHFRSRAQRIGILAGMCTKFFLDPLTRLDARHNSHHNSHHTH
eukprot:630199_1